MKKKTTTEKYIEKAVKETAKEVAGKNISNCNFQGVVFNEKATDAISDIADALCENAEACKENAIALKQLSYVLKASGVEIETMLKIEN